MTKLMVTIGSDFEGDSCLYISRGYKRYLNAEQLTIVADHLEEWLNSKQCPPSVRTIPIKPDPAEIDRLYEELTKGQDHGEVDKS